MSTLAGLQIKVMMRLKIHLQIIQNIAQVTNYFIKFKYFKVSQKTCTRAIKTIYKNKICTKCAHQLKGR